MSRWDMLEVDDYDEAAAAARKIEEAAAPSAPAPVPAPAPVLRSVAPLEFERGLRPMGEASPAVALGNMVDKLVAVEKADGSTGAVVFWSLPGEVDVEKLRAAWEAAGLEVSEVPEVPSTTVALSRAVKTRTSKTRFVTEHPDGGWVLVDEVRAGHTLDYKVGVHFKLEPDGSVSVGSDGTVPWAEESAEADAVRAEFARLRYGKLSAHDTSVWLVKLAAGLRAVSLRESGGFYFVPKSGVEKWKKIKTALTSCSAYVLSEIPAMHSAEAIAAVLEAFSREASVAVAEMTNELVAGTLGNRGNANRLRACDDITAKLVSYEELLGVKLDAPKARVKELRGKIAMATNRTALLEVD